MKGSLVLAAALGALIVAVPIAAADLSAPTITSNPPSPGNSTTPTLIVSTSPLAVVTVYSDSGCAGSILGTGPAGADGSFSLPTAVPSNAPTTFSASAFDGASTSPCTDYTYIEDSTPPGLPTINGPTDPTNSQDASFTFSASDAVAYTCTMDDPVQTDDCSDGSMSYSGLPEGRRTFTVTATDSAGNTNQASYPWTIDLTPPPKPTFDKTPDPVTNQASADFAFSDTEQVTFACQLDGIDVFSGCSSGPMNGSKDYGPLPDGSYQFQVVATDAAGNSSPPAIWDWTINTVNPVVTITQAPPHLTNQTSATFQFNSSDSSATFTCQLDAGAPTPCDNNSPPVYPVTNGVHTFTVRARTTAGNTGQASYTWTVDTVAPGTTITSAPPASSNSAVATFAFASSEAGSTFVCSLNSGGFTPCTSPETYSGLGDGTYTFRVEAVDAAGNGDPSGATYIWTIAGVGPPTRDLKPPANVSHVRRNVGYGRLQLRWKKPPDPDFDHVGVYVSTSPKTAPRTLIYSGKGQSYLDRHFKNGQYYRYLIVSYDHVRNASGGAGALVQPSALLKSPRSGRVVRGVPAFRWTAISGARYYNIQLYTHGEKVLSTWPAKARQVLTQRWQYKGHRYTLRPGLYVWWVWPGFGPRSHGHYGHLLGQGSFVVR